MDIPAALLQQVADGNAVLFLGAGASVGAVNPKGESPPSSRELAFLIADKFLGGEHRNAPLHIVSELAISETSLSIVQEYIRERFESFRPASFHGLIPTFRWAGIATTNFDLVVERAYIESRGRSTQTLATFIKNGDPVEQKLDSPDALMFLKLHGSITHTNDPEIPLILTTEQYNTHRRGRSRLFGHLLDWASRHTIIFVGHSLQDSDVRAVLQELGTTEARPRFYTVTPSLTDMEQRFWEGRRISPLKGTFEDFLRTLDATLTSAFRGVPIPVPDNELPIAKRFVVNNPVLSAACRSFLVDHVDYLRQGMPTDTVDPRLFYKGFHGGWATVEQGLDVHRRIADTILSDVVLAEDLRPMPSSRLYVVKGHAGSGKSVLMRRLAWETGIEFGKLALYVRDHGRFSFGVIKELHQVTNEPIYLFVDNAAEKLADLMDLMRRAQGQGIPLKVVAAERFSEWNSSCEDLNPYVYDSFEIKYLNHNEIIDLLDALRQHGSLGTLTGATLEEQLKAFEERAGRQLLVALHEATLGKPFEDIVIDEYVALQPDLAKQLYLAISFLNRFDVPVRAGIISRVFGLNFTQFKERFFHPLEQVVLTNYDPRSRDYVYRARHPHIAEILTERTLNTPDARLDLLLRMMAALNVDYEADGLAARRLLRARPLMDQFPNHEMIQRVFTAGERVVGDDAYLLHQAAIYEILRTNGNLEKATDLLRKARRLAPNDRTIIHSFAELSLRRAEFSKTDLEFDALTEDAYRLARSLAGADARDEHGYHTLVKVGLARIKRLLGSQQDWNDAQLNELVVETERVLQEGTQRFPNEPYLLAAEAQLSEVLKDNQRALSALRRAFDVNPSNAFIATRLGRLYAELQKQKDAMKVYERALEAGSQDKRIHFQYAMLLMEKSEDQGTAVEYHLRRAFTDGDRNYEAQFWYARQLYLNGEHTRSQEMFKRLREYPVNPALRNALRGPIKEGGRQRRFTGAVTRMEPTYAFVSHDGSAERVFLHMNNLDPAIWARLDRNSRVRFSLAFTFGGLTAFDIAMESE